jgi:hypothetical protein
MFLSCNKAVDVGKRTPGTLCVSVVKNNRMVEKSEEVFTQLDFISE